MAREKNTVEYFPFFVKEGRTLYTLKKLYGLEGIGFFTQLFRFLSNTPDHYYCIDDEIDRCRLIEFVGVSEEKLLKMLQTLVKTKKIDKGLYENYKIIASQDFFDSLEVVYSKRKKALMTTEQLTTFVKDSGTFRYFPSQDDPEPEHSESFREQRKGKERKGKEIIITGKKPVKGKDPEIITEDREKETKKKIREFFNKASPEQFKDGKNCVIQNKFIKELVDASKKISDDPGEQKAWIHELLVSFVEICKGRDGPSFLHNTPIVPSKMMSKGIYPEVLKVMSERKKRARDEKEIETSGFEPDFTALR